MQIVRNRDRQAIRVIEIERAVEMEWKSEHPDKVSMKPKYRWYKVKKGNVIRQDRRGYAIREERRLA